MPNMSISFCLQVEESQDPVPAKKALRKGESLSSEMFSLSQSNHLSQHLVLCWLLFHRLCHGDREAADDCG